MRNEQGRKFTGSSLHHPSSPSFEISELGGGDHQTISKVTKRDPILLQVAESAGIAGKTRKKRAAAGISKKVYRSVHRTALLGTDTRVGGVTSTADASRLSKSKEDARPGPGGVGSSAFIIRMLSSTLVTEICGKVLGHNSDGCKK